METPFLYDAVWTFLLDTLTSLAFGGFDSRNAVGFPNGDTIGTQFLKVQENFDGDATVFGDSYPMLRALVTFANRTFPTLSLTNIFFELSKLIKSGLPVLLWVNFRPLSSVRRMDVAYMREFWSKHRPSLRLRAIGADEISIRKGHSYAIGVADLDQKRPIWMSLELGRAEEDMDRFYDDMGLQRCRSLRLSGMDIWPAFRNSLARHAPKARVVFDKFHVIRHLGDALDEVRRREYWRVAKKDRRFIKGQRYTLLSIKRISI